MSLFFCITFPIVIIIMEKIEYFQRNKYIKFMFGVALLAYLSQTLADLTNNHFVFVQQSFAVSVFFLPLITTLLYVFMRKIVRN